MITRSCMQEKRQVINEFESESEQTVQRQVIPAAIW